MNNNEIFLLAIIFYINSNKFSDLAEEYGFDFLAFYAAIGLMNAMFLIIYVLINLSKLMKFSTRSIEEIFGFFITCAFCEQAIEGLIETFEENYTEIQSVALQTAENDVINKTCIIYESGFLATFLSNI